VRNLYYYVCLKFSASEQLAEEIKRLGALLAHPAVEHARYENPRIISSLVTFFRLLVENRVTTKFLPFLLLQDAIDLRNAKTSVPTFSPPAPHKECAAYHGTS
jgi:hypothetical protein